MSSAGWPGLLVCWKEREAIPETLLGPSPGRGPRTVARWPCYIPDGPTDVVAYIVVVVVGDFCFCSCATSQQQQKQQQQSVKDARASNSTQYQSWVAFALEWLVGLSQATKAKEKACTSPIVARSGSSGGGRISIELVSRLARGY
ncbi:hypothetical protein CIB48_g12302 [Xylaria polymorpha]|nr:hypothetical protein CIB48_g12302 [Xylaria polymorpha]